MAIDRGIGLQILEVLRDINDALEQIAENTTPDTGTDEGTGDGTEDA